MSSSTKYKKEKTKQEIAEKVKEIKKRQQNWMKQRSESSAQPDTSSTKTNQVKHPVTSKHKPSVDDNKDNHPHEVKSKFDNWLKSRLKGEQNTEQDSYYPSNPKPSTINSDQPLGHFKYDKPSTSHYDSVEHSGTSAIQLSARSQASNRSNISPDMFDALADQIVNRVKHELHVNNEGHLKSDTVHHSTNSETNVDDDSSGDIENHRCMLCQRIMMSPHHSPMLAIPCGHTFCRDCMEKMRKFCTSCGSRIKSSACNLMLQQIIQDYHHKHSREAGKSCQKANSSNQYNADKYAGNHYTDELDSISTRLDILRTEEAAINQTMEGISQKINKEKIQLESITMEENKIELQIKKLHQNLEKLQLHKVEYREKCEQLEHRHYEEASKLALVQETIESLQSNSEKLMLLSGYMSRHK